MHVLDVLRRANALDLLRERGQAFLQGFQAEKIVTVYQWICHGCTSGIIIASFARLCIPVL